MKNLQAVGPCELVVGYVDFPLEQLTRLGGTALMTLRANPAEVQAILERDLKARVTELLGSSDFLIRIEPNWGYPEVPLAEMAGKDGADLIVVGSHQYQGLERLWNRSVSSGLLHGAPVSLLIAPLTVRKKLEAPITPPMRKVLVTTDFSALANQAIPNAYSLLRGGGTLHIVHVIHPHELPDGDYLRGPANHHFRTQHANQETPGTVIRWKFC